MVWRGARRGGAPVILALAPTFILLGFGYFWVKRGLAFDGAALRQAGLGYGGGALAVGGLIELRLALGHDFGPALLALVAAAATATALAALGAAALVAMGRLPPGAGRRLLGRGEAGLFGVGAATLAFGLSGAASAFTVYAVAQAMWRGSDALAAADGAAAAVDAAAQGGATPAMGTLLAGAALSMLAVGGDGDGVSALMFAALASLEWLAPAAAGTMLVTLGGLTAVRMWGAVEGRVSRAALGAAALIALARVGLGLLAVWLAAEIWLSGLWAAGAPASPVFTTLGWGLVFAFAAPAPLDERHTLSAAAAFSALAACLVLVSCAALFG